MCTWASRSTQLLMSGIAAEKAGAGRCLRGRRDGGFLYRDSSDRLISTITKPMQLGEVACLEVAEVGKMGAFLKWGLEKIFPSIQRDDKARETGR